ncbi:hypothetical protein SAMN05216410_0608 [Sanguibacter gelidistatuariae]|uniref:Uncharacterized protein n=1 Tax=Sanguibacter gelidistatuariae TaxID=1814289 RepID=A0A1G6H273_9MICO|nr:hypothetical protein [Sanguibacter gelidistatuariae]SDB87506.1 hypothetical protein SAMN05216410_0608 [Sanguibacter gelidistatuariae]
MTSKTTRLATASLLAIALPLATGSVAFADTVERQDTLVQVRSQADVVSRDITSAVTHTSVLPAALRAQTRNAIASTQAATSTAKRALRAVDAAEPFSAWSTEDSLNDARTALDAASAELRYVTASVAGIDAGVSTALLALQHDLDVLRGTTADA